VRAGVFRAEPGTLRSSVWRNPEEQEIFRAHFWVELNASGTTLLHVSYGVPSSSPLVHYAQNEIVEIVKAPLYFGLRRWFVCPGVYHNDPCRKRVRILYFPPSARRLGCRKCHNLIHRSAREHDSRVDALLRLPVEEFRARLQSNTLQLGSLTFRAGVVLRRRLEKKAARLNRKRHSNLS
jgi:hypothetical protein